MATKNADLEIGGYTVQTLDDLRSHFDKEDVFNHFDNYDLQYFLKANGYVEELKKVSSIASTEKEDIINELCAIFDVNIDEKAIAQKMFETKIKLKEFKQEYDELIEEINNNPENMIIIKKCLKKLTSTYKTFIELDTKIIDKLPTTLMIFACLLSNETFRELYDNKKIKLPIDKYLKELDDVYYNEDNYAYQQDKEYPYEFRDENNSTYIKQQKEIFKDKILFNKDLREKYKYESGNSFFHAFAGLMGAISASSKSSLFGEEQSQEESKDERITIDIFKNKELLFIYKENNRELKTYIKNESSLDRERIVCVIDLSN